jgi:hypothetical protein
MNKNKLKKLLLSLIILFFINCTISPRNPLDSSQPLGAIYQLIPIFFPGLRPSSAKALKTYFISESGSSGAIKGRDITLTVPFSTNLDSLTAEFYHTGQDITVNSVKQVSGETKNNFNNPLVYRVKAVNTTTLDYTLKTSKGSSTSYDLTSFSLASNPQINSYSGIITGSLVTVYVPNGTDLTSLTAVFSHNGKKVQVGGVDQTSSQSKQNFSSQLVYSVYSEVGAKQDYTVSVLLGASDSKEIKAFWLDSLQATIIGTDILLGIGSDKSYKSLMTDFIHTGSEVRVNGKSVVSGENSFDYSDPVTFTVVARDGSTKDYKVIVSSSNAFSIGGFVSGLGTGKSMILQNNGGDNTTIVANGNFSFNATVPNYGAYTVTVLTQPTNQYCTVTNGTGAANASVTNILVDCNNNPGTTVQSFTDLGNQTIKDNNTGLIWMKCTMSNVPGVPLDGIGCNVGTAGFYKYCRENDNDCNGGTNTGAYGTLITTGFSGTYPGSFGTLYDFFTAGADHYIAYKACNDANTTPVGGFAGKTNWRVPTKDELLSLVDFTKNAPAINDLFTNTPANNHWSSSPNPSALTTAFQIHFSSGSISSVNKTTSTNYRVRCVSGP